MDEYFCPNCGDILNYQSGFDSSLGVWVCTSCGQQLIDGDVYNGDRFEDFAWFCDECGAFLNRQYGFSDSLDSWTCTECGYRNSIAEDDIIDGKHFVCPECGETLNNQSGFNCYNDEWECTSCGAKLEHDYYNDDYRVVDNTIDIDGKHFVCPECGETLNNQSGFNCYDDEWECTSCGAKLEHNYYNDDYSVVDNTTDDDEYEEDEDNDDDEYDEDDDEENDTEQCDGVNIGVPRKDKSELRWIRIKAFLFSKKRVPIGYDSSDLEGKNYKEVQILLYNRAFKNIKLVSKKDVYIDSIYEDGETELVVADGTSDFNDNYWVQYNAEIVITYHEKREISVPFSFKLLRKANYREAIKKLEDLGFTNVIEKPICDLVTGWITKNGFTENVSIMGDNNFKKDSVYKYDVPIVVEFHTFKNKKKW